MILIRLISDDGRYFSAFQSLVDEADFILVDRQRNDLDPRIPVVIQDLSAIAVIQTGDPAVSDQQIADQFVVPADRQKQIDIHLRNYAA